MRPRGCRCTICPHCQSGAGVESAWVLPRPFGPFWFAYQHCPRCGSRWASWHWLEQKVGLLWTRVFVFNPGRHSITEIAEWVRLQRKYQRHPEEVR